ncbi:putative nuclease HARBI1 [Hordeum vulgare]|nr:putative nuclease HARBI1 [Hordeum vulgare]
MTHKAYAPFLNTPIEHYHALTSICGTIGAKGLGARSGNDIFSIYIEHEENVEVNTSANVGESSDPKAPPKNKAKVKNVVDYPLVITLKDGFKPVAEALAKSSGDDDNIPDDLWDVVSVLLDFDEVHLAHYYVPLVDNPKIAKAFMKLTQINKCVWVRMYVKKYFCSRYGCMVDKYVNLTHE